MTDEILPHRLDRDVVDALEEDDEFVLRGNGREIRCVVVEVDE